MHVCVWMWDRDVDKVCVILGVWKVFAAFLPGGEGGRIRVNGYASISDSSYKACGFEKRSWLPPWEGKRKLVGLWILKSFAASPIGGRRDSSVCVNIKSVCGSLPGWRRVRIF